MQRALDGNTMAAIIMKVIMGELAPLPTIADLAARPHCPDGQIPAALAAVAMKALSLKPEGRYQTVKEMQADIKAYQAGFATRTGQAGLWCLLLFVKYHRMFAISALLIVLALAMGLTVVLIPWRKAREAEPIICVKVIVEAGEVSWQW